MNCNYFFRIIKKYTNLVEKNKNKIYNKANNKFERNKKVDKVRELALKILYKIDNEKAYSNIILNEEINKNRKIIDERDIGFISEIVYGVTTWKLTIDEIIRKYSKIRLKKISPWIITILRMGVYQIVFLDKVPKSAAVNESVNLAKRYGHKSSSNFVNAILRKISKKDYEDFFDIDDNIERISKTTSMPVWIIEKLLKEKDIRSISAARRSDSGMVTRLAIDTEHFQIMISSQHCIRTVLATPGDILIKQDGSAYSMGELLPSAFFYLESISEEGGISKVIIHGGGMGHGVGMSQNGAKCLAQQGYTYGEILKYFYQDICIEESSNH